MPPEVGQELRILVYPQKLADDFNGENFRGAQRCGGSACSEPPEVSDAVIYEAEDGYDEGVKKIRERETSFLLRLVWHHRA